MIARACALAAATLFAIGCTAVKPLACAVVYPTAVIVHDWNTTDDEEAESEEYNDLPPAAILAVAPILIPLRFAYLTVNSAVAGVVSGFVSDLNLITGHASFETTMDTICVPLKTNAMEPDDL